MLSCGMSTEPDKLILPHLRALRSELADVRTISLASVDHARRIERRLDEVRDDLELMIKAEPVGRLGHFETQIEAQTDRMREQIDQAGRRSKP